MIGEKVSEILENLETTLLQHDASVGTKYNYTHEGFRAAIYIFSSVMLDKLWELQETEKLSLEDRLNMAQSLGDAIRKLVKTYTDIDTLIIYNEK